MRSDMGKVITERERGGSRSKSIKNGESVRWQGHEHGYDEQPKFAKISARAQYGYDHKTFTDVLGPVKGFIRKNVGKKWDKVYSEICKVLDKRKLTHAHVIGHIYDWVGRTVVYCSDGYWREPDNITCRLDDDGKLTYFGSAPDFYVHPRTGILMKNKARESKRERQARWNAKKADPDFIKINDHTAYKRINDIWYKCQIRDANKHEIELHKFVHSQEYTDNKTRVFVHGRESYYIEEKKQVGGKELKLLKERLA